VRHRQDPVVDQRCLASFRRGSEVGGKRKTQDERLMNPNENSPIRLYTGKRGAWKNVVIMVQSHDKRVLHFISSSRFRF
jgi:hypothetical protein